MAIAYILKGDISWQRPRICNGRVQCLPRSFSLRRIANLDRLFWQYTKASWSYKMASNSHSATGATSEEGGTSRKTKRSRSVVWEHFTKIEREDGGEPNTAKCNYCGAKFSCRSANDTSSLWKHLKRCDEYPCNKEKRQKVSSSQNEGQEVDGGSTVWKFDQEVCRKALVRLVIVNELPFRFVESEGFKYFCASVQPKFKMLSRMTIARDIVNLHLIEKKNLKEALSNSSQRICLTTDCWTSIQNVSYICITAHFIDNDWKLHKRILNFSVISNHKGVGIAQAIESCMLHWGIEKVFTITVDNASANDTAISNLKKKIIKRNGFVLGGEHFHVRCCAHILNLIVRDGIEEGKDSISRIRGAVRYIRSSPQRSQQFKACCEKERIESKSGLCLDVPTRWNSTYLMLESALKFQKAFERLNEEDSHFASDLMGAVPNEINWDYAKVLVKFLKSFYDATKRMSGSLYVTSNTYFHEVCQIEKILSDWTRSEDFSLCRMALKMKQKFDKYWGSLDKMNMMLLVAVVLDPRYKLKYVNFCYRRLYDLDKVNALVKKVKDLVIDLYKHYQLLDSTSTSPLVRTLCPSNMDLDQGQNDTSLQLEFLKELEEEENASSKSEVDRYLDEGFQKGNENFEVLGWWKLNCSKYRILAQVARDIFAIPISTVASESAFSTGGRVLDQFRSSLAPKVVEGLVCTQNWLRASPLPVQSEEKFEEFDDFELVTLEASDLTDAFPYAVNLSL